MAGKYQRFTNEPHEQATGKRFYVMLAGRTNKAHNGFVEKLKSIGHTEVTSHDQCDYVVLFCPIASRVGTDISEAENSMPAGKPMILVVMHHTFDADCVVSESSKIVRNPNIRLTVDCLFFDDHLLNCKRNESAWSHIQKYLKDFVTQPEMSRSSSPSGPSSLIVPSDLIGPSGPYGSILSPSVSSFMTNWKRFFVKLAGRTNKAHNGFVEKLKSIGHTEVTSHDQCDYVVLFCPVASRVGTDISEAENNMPAGKPTILVVMHHTFDADLAISESSKIVRNPNIRLTVDCLFFDDHLLNCKRNESAWSHIQKYLKDFVTQPEMSRSSSPSGPGSLIVPSDPIGPSGPSSWTVPSDLIGPSGPGSLIVPSDPIGPSDSYGSILSPSVGSFMTNCGMNPKRLILMILIALILVVVIVAIVMLVMWKKKDDEEHL